MAMLRCECGNEFEPPEAQVAADATCPKCGKPVSAPETDGLVADFLSDLEDGRVRIGEHTRGRDEDGVPAKKGPGTQENGFARASARIPRQNLARAPVALHASFKKLAFWPCVVMGIVMFAVAALSVKEMLANREEAAVPTTIDGDELRGGYIYNRNDEKEGPGKLENGMLVLIIDGRPFDIGKNIIPGVKKQRPVAVFAILGAFLGALLMLAAYSFRKSVKQEQEAA
ncbi:MAG: hypothetical protein QGD94_08595 [Planctomycetia bacterium]|nr:hypothetical protein [Planctomycetia bacterium]